MKLIDDFFTFENYESNGKKAFYGHHWREYTAPELVGLFASAGFKIRAGGSFTAFQSSGKIGIARQLLRVGSRIGTTVFPRYGTNIFLMAVK